MRIGGARFHPRQFMQLGRVDLPGIGQVPAQVQQVFRLSVIIAPTSSPTLTCAHPLSIDCRQSIHIRLRKVQEAKRFHRIVIFIWFVLVRRPLQIKDADDR